MVVSKLLPKFTQGYKSNKKSTVSLFISHPLAVIAFSSGNAFSVANALSSSNNVTVDKLDCNADYWSTALKLMDKNNLSKVKINLILGQGLYQSLLIDDPLLSEEDKFAALPFKIKDFISEPASNVVADGYSLPIAKRFQVFATHKSQLVQFAQQLEKRGCQLAHVAVEDIALRQWTQLDQTEVVLSRAGNSIIQFSVFSLGKFIFQRQIRGVRLEDLSSSPERVNALLAEIQHSLDYLSGQLKEVKITGMIVALQGVDNQKLVAELTPKLAINIRVQNYFQGDDYHQHLALAALQDNYHPEINLFSKSLLPKKQLITFEKMLASWGAVFILVLIFATYQKWRLLQLEETLNAQREDLNIAQRLANDLEDRIKLHLPSALLVNEVEQAKTRLEIKKSTLAAVEKHDLALKQGYESTFRALSALSSRNISISTIAISLNYLDLNGLAATPEAVPSWLQSFQSQPVLAGRHFEQMTLNRDEQDRFYQFHLISKRQ